VKNYYHLLGVKPEADINEIKKAYKKLAVKFHPDKNEGDEYFKERFQDIQEAFKVLSDSQLKDDYDKKLFEYDKNLFESNLPVVTLKVNKKFVEQGDDVIFKWSTKHVERIEIFANNKVIEELNQNGQITFNQYYNANYRFVFHGNGQQITKIVEVKIIENTQKTSNFTTLNDSKSSADNQIFVQNNIDNGKKKKTFGQLLSIIIGSIVLSIMLTAFLLIVDDNILKMNLLTTYDGKVNFVYWLIFSIIFIISLFIFNFLIGDENNKRQNEKI
jgi:curved DNA-binding protein CbpA